MTDRLSTTVTGMTSATERAANSAACMVADSAPLSEMVTTLVAPSAANCR